MLEIHGTVMHYPWGTTDAIPEILGIPTDGRPHAEYWLGAHALAPSSVANRHLDALVAADPTVIGDTCVATFGHQLPFLMKLLSARHALSIQAHPNRTQAEDGYRRENAAGLAIDDPTRSYKDPWPKPEIIIALSEFRMLLGFRDPLETYALFEGLGVAELLAPIIGPLAHRHGSAGTEEVFLDVLCIGDDRAELVNQLLAAAVRQAGEPDGVGEFARLIVELDEHFPGSPGILAACMMNLVTLQPGQAAFIPTGTLHAHLCGTGVEVMANSDNVVRGGLTPKHIAVEELVSVVDFGVLTPQILPGQETSPGIWSYPTGSPEFEVWRIESSGDRDTALPAHGAVRIALVTQGVAQLSDADGGLEAEHGQAVFVPATNAPLTVRGDAEVFMVAPGVR